MNWRLPPQLPPPFEGPAVFETCQVKRGRILFLSGHLHRLRASIQTLGTPTWDEGFVRSQLTRAAREVEGGFVRIAVHGPAGRVIIYKHPGTPYTKSQKKRGVDLTTVPTRWPSGETAFAQVKSSERLGSVLARLEGGDSPEVLRVGPHGYLTEGTVSNFFLVKNGTLLTPPTWLGVLEGVTRSRVLRSARRWGIPSLEVPVSRHELFNADEAFLTNVLMGVFPIRTVDGRRIGTSVPGLVTRRLAQVIEKTGLRR